MSRNTKQEDSSVEKAHAGETATGDAAAGTDNALAATQESLDKVRDILFGEQARDQERRYHDLESKFTGELETLRQESQRRLASIETLAKRDTAAVVEQLKAESGQRSQAMSELTAQLKEMIATAERRISSVDEQHTNDARALRDELLTRSRALREELNAQSAALKGFMDKSLSELNHIKADRAALAVMFRDLAERLSA